MKNSKFVAFFIAIVAPIVKLFPSWALKFTKKSNPFAEKFMISSKREIKYLTKHLKSVAWISERQWHLQTYKYVFALKDKRSLAFQAFISNIDNSEVFDAAYAEVPEEAVKAKSYTLDSKRVITACNDNINFLYCLEKKQPRSFTPDIVRQLEEKARGAYYAFLYTSCHWKELTKLDFLLYQDWKNASTQELRGNAKCCLSLLLGLENYQPSISAAQLSSLGETWCQKANPFIVADKMLQYWKESENFNKILALLERILKTPDSQEKDAKSQELLGILRNSELYTKAVLTMMRNGIACPKDFISLQNNEEWVKVNLTLCIEQKVEDKIPLDITRHFSEALKTQQLFALAERGKLSLDLLSDVQNARLKQELMDILEEQAQSEWFNGLLVHSIKDADIQILKHSYETGTIYGKTQDLSFRDQRWVLVFVENGWYDISRQVKLMQSAFVSEIRVFSKKYGITQEQFEALLTGPNAELVPEARQYLK